MGHDRQHLSVDLEEASIPTLGGGSCPLPHKSNLLSPNFGFYIWIFSILQTHSAQNHISQYTQTLYSVYGFSSDNSGQHTCSLYSKSLSLGLFMHFQILLQWKVIFKIPGISQDTGVVSFHLVRVGPCQLSSFYEAGRTVPIPPPAGKPQMVFQEEQS